MKTRIALGATLLLTIGSAVAGSYVYAQQERAEDVLREEPKSEQQARSDVTPEMIAMWKSTAASSDYVVPKLPI